MTNCRESYGGVTARIEARGGMVSMLGKSRGLSALVATAMSVSTTANIWHTESSGNGFMVRILSAKWIIGMVVAIIVPAICVKLRDCRTHGI